MSRIENISGIILAGGKNTRFEGRIKALEKIDGISILHRTEEILKKIFREVIIISNDVELFQKHTSLPIYSDFFLEKGPIGGIHAGLMRISSSAGFFIAGDMPLISEEIISEMVEYYIENEINLLVPEIEQKIEPLHAIYSRHILSDIEQQILEGKKMAIREVFKIHPPEFYKFDKSKAVFFSNINYPQDLLGLPFK